ncbi:MAG: acetolactate decarboxylase, partial [Clostridia bacterium]|nr:acetolactate decarboxylase [Clostridia bacterium]
FIVCALLTGCTGNTPAQDTLFQVSTLDSLMQGVYDGELTLEELLQHGDFGIGTFDALDGEMVILDGTVYQVLSSGEVVQPDLSVTTPFAMITQFNADIQSDVSFVSDYNKLKETIGSLLPSQNEIYAIEIHGTFSYIEARSVPAQTEPYPLLSEVTEEQTVFEYKDVTGTLVGYWCPEYLSGINLAGYHLHFLSEDHTMGGHLLECSIENAAISIDTVTQFQMLIPQNEHFLQTDFGAVTEQEKQNVEQ